MELSGLIAQNTIAFPVLSGAHATLSAASSMGQMLVFESAVAPVASELVAGIKARRVARALQKALPILSEASAIIAATELEATIDQAMEALRASDAATYDGTAMAHAVLVMTALDRTRLACAVMLDLCEALGVAPNGKPLRTRKKTPSGSQDAGANALFDNAL